MRCGNAKVWATVILVGWGAQAAGAQAAAAVDPKVWEVASDDDGIIVHTKKNETGETITIRGQTTIPLAPAKVKEIIMDNDLAPSWVPRLNKRRTVKSVGPKQRIEYSEIAVPWPFTDTYFVSEGTEADLPGGGYLLKMVSLANPDKQYLNKDLILGEIKQSDFTLIPASGGKATDFTVIINFDLKQKGIGSVVNALLKSWPRDFFNGLLKVLKSKQLVPG